MEEMAVSIVCNVFNHEKYIANALEGFVRQKTNFPFEVLVHDDASTDGTATIIRQYESKYPHLIKPIYETENQWSKHDGSLKRLQFSRAKGKYIAFCEGDDFWIDDYKLQKQFEYMEAHPNCTFCCTNGYRKTGRERKGRLCISKIPATRQIFTDLNNRLNMTELVLINAFPTASYFIPTWILQEMPPQVEGCFSGDVYIRLYAASLGYGYFIKEPTCIYNARVKGSVTDHWRKSRTARLRHIEKMLNLYDHIDQITDYRYHDVMELAKKKEAYERDLANYDSRAIKEGGYWLIVKQFGFRAICRYFAVAYFPFFFALQRKLRKLDMDN